MLDIGTMRQPLRGRGQRHSFDPRLPLKGQLWAITKNDASFHIQRDPGVVIPNLSTTAGINSETRERNKFRGPSLGR
jgi:hypothetical protein